MQINKLWDGTKLFWYLFQKPIMVIIIVVLCFQNNDKLILLFKQSADWVAGKAGVAVTEHVIVVESKKPKKVVLPKGVRPKPDEGFMWPVTGPITSPFGPRWGGEFHHGIDIAVPQGTEVACAKDGYVLKTGWSDYYGNFVQIDHGDGVSTLYGHNSLLYARQGELIKQGDTIALSGSTGRSTGPHVHFEIRISNKAVNPLSFTFDGIERGKYAKKVEEQSIKQLADENNPDEIKRKYLITLEKTKELKLAALRMNIKEALKHWDTTIAYQYRASYGLTSDTTKYLSSGVVINESFHNAILNISELLPILAAQIQINNDPKSMVVKEVNFSIKS